MGGFFWFQDVQCFRGYMEQEENKPPTGREFELNLMEKN
jgi:hypothetical protein